MNIDEKLNAIWKEFLEPIPEKTIYGDYRKPQTLLVLKHLTSKNLVKLESLGFYLNHEMPYAPQPIDIIPFASTGVDGTYFAFLTDFGEMLDLEIAPIIMYCNADMNYKNPKAGCLLFANNILDFVSIIIQTLDPYIVFENDPRYTDFNSEILEFIDDEPDEKRDETIEILKRNLPIPQIDNLNEYYLDLFHQRSINTRIKTKDGLNINFNEQSKNIGHEINSMLSKEDLELKLSKMDKLFRLKFYRDYGSLYPDLRTDEFLYVFDVLIEFLKKDKLQREASVLEFDLKKQKAYNLYHDLKKGDR